MYSTQALESLRLDAQSRVDASKSNLERNKLGQFATPTILAGEVVAKALSYLDTDSPIRFLDPALGTGSFYSALLRSVEKNQIDIALGYEIDPQYGIEAQKIWGSSGLNVVIDDFTKIVPPASNAEKFNLLICNPPYVRHHHLHAQDKKRLSALSYANARVKLSGLAGLYTYFMCISHGWLREDAISAWLIPSEFMDVNYGQAIRKYLSSQVSLLGIHRFDPEEVQFTDALVSSAVVFFRKARELERKPSFSFGGYLLKPSLESSFTQDELVLEPKWTRLTSAGRTSRSQGPVTKIGDLFTIKRGVATGSNDFFVLTEQAVSEHSLPYDFLIPFLPSPRYISSIEIRADDKGFPIIGHPRYLLSCDLPESTVQKDYPTLWQYLLKGKEQGIHERYLCTHRHPWYMQDRRTPALFLCNYMGRTEDASRRNPFRFILNHSIAVAPNVYLNLYPRPRLAQLLATRDELKQVILEKLCEIPVERLIGDGRVYGGGLYKLEPRELQNVEVNGLDKVLEEGELSAPFQLGMFSEL